MFGKLFTSVCIRLFVLTFGIILSAGSASAATYIVTSPSDDNPPTPGTLRYAIQQAQTNSGPDSIFFDITGPCPCVVSLDNDLFVRTEVFIDGTNEITLHAASLVTVFDVSGSGNLVIRNLDIMATSATSFQAISNSATVTLEKSTIRGFWESGIRNGGQATVIGSTIFNNISQGDDGGGIRNSGTLTVINSTISGNRANKRGGGIYNSGTLTVLNSTIANNRSNVPDGQEESVFYDGGGIHSGGAETLQNTIIIGNAIQSESAQPDISDDISGGVIDSYSNVLVGNPGTAGQMVDGTNGSIIGKNNGTQLLPENEVIFGLADTGGPTKTHAFRPASPAIDAGNTAFAVGPDGTTPLATDQRGTGFPRVVGSSVDIGVWEGEPNVAPEILDFAVSGPIDEGGTVTLTGTISDGNAGDVFGGSIDWGDGSPDETIGSLGVGPFQFTHTFADNDADGV